MSLGKSRVVGNMHVFVVCQIDFNMQLVSQLSWNNPLLETSLGESYILTDDLQTSRCQEKTPLGFLGSLKHIICTTPRLWLYRIF